MFSDKRVKELESRVAALEEERNQLRKELAEAMVASKTPQSGSSAIPLVAEEPLSPASRPRPSEFTGSVSSASIVLLAAAEDAVKTSSPFPKVPRKFFRASEQGDAEEPAIKHVTDTHLLSRRSAHDSPEDDEPQRGRESFLNFGDPSLFAGNVVLTFQPDSPAHRRQVATLAANVEALRERLQRLVKCARDYVRAGNEYSRLGRLFAAELVDLHFRNGPKSASAVRVGDLGPVLAELGKTVEEIQSYRDTFLVSLETTFCAPMEAFVKREIKGVRQMKVESQRSLEEHEQDLGKLLQLRNDADAAVVSQRKQAASASYKRHELARFDLVHELNQLEMKKKFQLVERVCNGLYAELGYFHQCHIVMANMEPRMRDLQLALQLARKKFAGADRIWAAKRKQLEIKLDRAESGADPGVFPGKGRRWAAWERSGDGNGRRHPTRSSLRLGRSVALGLRKTANSRLQGEPKDQAKLTIDHEQHEKTSRPSGADTTDDDSQPTLSPTSPTNLSPWTLPGGKLPPPPPEVAPAPLPTRGSGHRRSLSANAAESPGAGPLHPCMASAVGELTAPQRLSSCASEDVDSVGGQDMPEDQEGPIRRGSGGDLDHVVAAAAAIVDGVNEGAQIDPASSSYVVKEGYLWKRSSNVRKDWKRRYFKIMAGRLFYEKLEGGPPTKVCDIMLCTVRERVKSHANLHSFEIISPGNRTFTLQAESRKDMESWIHVIRSQTESLIVSTERAQTDAVAAEKCDYDQSNGRLSSSGPADFELVKALMDSNRLCVDCNRPRPDWCSINLGILMCIECSGVHRALGAHISKVRSLTLDVLPCESLCVMECLGNDAINKVYESGLHEVGASKIGPGTTRDERETFIRDKYENRKFIKPFQPTAQGEVQKMLYDAAADGNMQGAIQAMAMGAHVNKAAPDAGGNTALHAAAAGGHVRSELPLPEYS
uniref:Uncharacterized protein n=1 Tax=Pinguiococcus pyrenoidosus TaxID=172671 RepID=A0A7R9U3L3_9STRA|mmetsp:Transcript_1356/g.5820  ORF Transcript_1356/g.5820 Transcript_1356/m.5820 type:complete len:943 (+) Transcript_1356:205-3033(+)